MDLPKALSGYTCAAFLLSPLTRNLVPLSTPAVAVPEVTPGGKDTISEVKGQQSHVTSSTRKSEKHDRDKDRHQRIPKDQLSSTVEIKGSTSLLRSGSSRDRIKGRCCQQNSRQRQAFDAQPYLHPAFKVTLTQKHCKWAPRAGLGSGHSRTTLILFTPGSLAALSPPFTSAPCISQPCKAALPQG